MRRIFSALLASAVTTVLYAAEPAVTDSNEPTAQKTTGTQKQNPAVKSKSNLRNNLFYGGYINLSFGNYTVIGIEPMIGYKINPKLSMGVKARYDYIKDDRYAKTYTTSTYGGSLFGRYLVNPNFYAHAEAASYSYEFFSFPTDSSEREWVPFLFLGGGFIQPLGERSWLNVQIVFDVLQDNSSPYDDWQPFFSIGVGTGF
ncbi:MtrB/PioB family outer membrane beta-barrel protein [Pontiellaceae bacterium B12227]|nr:MtrB/PioB family outer membrane beta-barrel protein [Pontiellaceae bacterium B12227]